MKARTKLRTLSRRQANEARSAVNVEPRWPILLAIFAVLSLFSLMPERSRFLPSWSGFAIGVALISLMIGVRLGGNRARWLRVERWAMLALASALLAMTLLGVAFLVMEIMNQTTKYAGQQLLTVGIEAWVTNVLAFSIVYWDLDRGGPEVRASDSAARPTGSFPRPDFPRRSRPAGDRPMSTTCSSPSRPRPRSARPTPRRSPPEPNS